MLKVHQCRSEYLQISLSSHENENSIPKVLHFNSIYFLSYAHPGYLKCLLADIEKQ